MRYAAVPLALALIPVGCQAPDPEPEPPGPCDCEPVQGEPALLGGGALAAGSQSGVLDPMTDIDGPYCPDCVLMVQADFNTGTTSHSGELDVLPTHRVQPEGNDSSVHWYDIPDDAWSGLRDAMLAPGVEWRSQWSYNCGDWEDGYQYTLSLWLPGEEEGRYRVSGLMFTGDCVYEEVRQVLIGEEWYPAIEEMWTVLEAMVKVYYASHPYRDPEPDGPMYYLFEDE